MCVQDMRQDCLQTQTARIEKFMLNEKAANIDSLAAMTAHVMDTNLSWWKSC